MATDADAALALANLQIVDATPATLRCSDCHRLAVGAVKLPCCKANICHTCSVVLYDTCPIYAHRSVTRGDCKPNKELREAVRARRSTDREKYGSEHREEIVRRRVKREDVERERAEREANRRDSGCIATHREEKLEHEKLEQEECERAKREIAAHKEVERFRGPSKRLQPTPVALPSIPLKECGVCNYDVSVDQCIPITPTEDVVCFQCFEEGVKPLFEKALLHEHEYPARWGATLLDPAHFAKLLPPSFATKWMFRQREYDRPAKEKVYCRHLVAFNESSNAALKNPTDSRAVDAECSTLFWRTEAHLDGKTITLQDLLYNLNAYFAVKLRSDQTSSTQTWEALERSVDILQYTLQFQFILAELPRFDPINENARDEFLGEVEQIEYLAASVTTPAALQRQQAHALHPIIASALALYRERHDAFVEELDARAVEARAAGRLELATLDRSQHDPDLVPLRTMTRSALANAASDPPNATRWRDIHHLLSLRLDGLRMLMIVHFLPQSPNLVEHYFAKIHLNDEIIELITAYEEAGPKLIQQAANGLVDVMESRDLLGERYNELVERVQPAIVTAIPGFASKEELTHIKPAIVTATGAFAAPDVFAALQHA
ncbi:hypothetical protein LTR35_013211 [Friedmanniomyces endolithicus]|uniref:RING-type domain-containing protein n=1 Tax=Friedmanniomyces endolithicus TaxID=329885 RepID=A0AAN6J4R0_9PEZI|nr:hypothetical protein LTS00_016580 [Friedmanniomyces endolithicus]KAK0271735.1 hypothetical protein LTR35_013211 [Friedmanniomyces endolithicus]KAK0315204.1 hypothetical protein LTR82_012531 [Friedmanniomyces endolithicus]